MLFNVVRESVHTKEANYVKKKFLQNSTVNGRVIVMNEASCS